jgi:hypothetical protein
MGTIYQIYGKFKKFSIDKTRTTAFRPQSDGLVERFNRTLEDILSKYVSQNQKDWDEQLPWALMAYRSSEHDTTKFSPCTPNLQTKFVTKLSTIVVVSMSGMG